MSALKVYSQFYYGHTVTIENQFIDFEESATVKEAEVEIGEYTLTKFLEVVAQACNDALNATTTVSVNRTTGIVTLDFSSAVSLKGATGAHTGASLLTLLGIPDTDFNNVTQVVGTLRSGSIWRPQFFLQDYVPTRNNKKAASATVSKSASGNVSVQKFGDEIFMKCNAKYITDIIQQPDFHVETNTNAVSEALAFMEYAITKSPLEFMENRNDAETFERLILESSPQSPDGVGFELREYYDRNLPFYYETGRLTFRKLEDI